VTKTRADDELLGQLHLAVTQSLLDKVKSGEATPAEISAAIKLLANNHIEVDTVPGSNMEKLAKALPVFNDDEPDEITAH
jgi:hypothetical protein